MLHIPNMKNPRSLTVSPRVSPHNVSRTRREERAAEMIRKYDTDGDGVLDEQELACSLYDTDGDGQLSNIELCMKKYDKDGNGVFSILEVKAIMTDLSEMTKNARRSKLLALGIFVVCLVCCGLMFGVTLSANEASKENHVSSDGTLVGLNGEAVGVTQVMSQASLYDMVGFGLSVLGSLDHVELVVDMTSDANIQKKVAMTVKIASVWKPEDTAELHMSSPEGYLLHINAGDKTATITIGGKKFPIVNTEDEAKVRGRGLRRKLSFAGALMTSGSFTMMAANGGV